MKTERCLLCFEDIEYKISLMDWLQQDSLLCGSCKQQLALRNLHTRIEKMPLHILYLYNEFLENMLYQYKENKDIALCEVFFHDHMKKINDKYRHYQIIIMPSSYEKIQERGFHHMKEMLRGCKLPILDPFIKTNNRKQSLQSYEQRQNISAYIHLDQRIKLLNRPILLVDDVVTTGATLKHAYHLLKKHNNRIEAMVLCAHPMFVESCDEM